MQGNRVFLHMSLPHKFENRTSNVFHSGTDSLRKRYFNYFKSYNKSNLKVIRSKFGRLQQVHPCSLMVPFWLILTKNCKKTRTKKGLARAFRLTPSCSLLSWLNSEQKRFNLEFAVAHS